MCVIARSIFLRRISCEADSEANPVRCAHHGIASSGLKPVPRNDAFLFFFLFSLLLFPVSGYSIEVGGHITEDTTWYPEDNPYHVVSDIHVDTGATLTIAPGCIIQLETAHVWDDDGFIKHLDGPEADAKMFWVDGRLIAEGTEQDSIVFTRYGDGSLLLGDNPSLGTKPGSIQIQAL